MVLRNCNCSFTILYLLYTNNLTQKLYFLIFIYIIRRSVMKSLLKVLLAGIFLFGSVPTLQASSDAGMEEIKKKKKKKGKKVKGKEKGKKGKRGWWKKKAKTVKAG